VNFYSAGVVITIVGLAKESFQEPNIRLFNLRLQRQRCRLERFCIVEFFFFLKTRYSNSCVVNFYYAGVVNCDRRIGCRGEIYIFLTKSLIWMLVQIRGRFPHEKFHTHLENDNLGLYFYHPARK
jgi:hypothetical protein